MYSNFRSQTPAFYILICVLFILANSISIFRENYSILGISIVLFIAYYTFFEFEKIYFFAVFTTTLSISLEWLVPTIPFNLSLPSEPLMIILLFLIILKNINKAMFESKILVHPISIAVLLYLFWIFITSITSSMPLVSFKYLFSKIWFTIPLFFFPILLFRKQKNIFLFFTLYIISFSIVIIYTINHHLSFGLFDKQAAHFVMKPFFNDHTSYGAVLAMYIPIIGGLLFYPKIKIHFKFFIIAALSLFSTAIVLSLTRAAWISILGMTVLLFLILFKIRLRYIAIAAIAVIALLFTYRVEIIDKLNNNKQDSSADLKEHVKSISNIATDASNLERINRWNAAIKMFYERPVIGWGPGAYMFQYAPFQMAKDETIISTDFAEGGNAHSEYISPLVEQGVPGFLIFLLLIGATIFTALKVFYNTKNKKIKVLSLISLLSLTTYFIHGLLNNFLDTDKASVPFWGMIAIICSLDIYALDENKNPQPGGAEER